MNAVSQPRTYDYRRWLALGLVFFSMAMSALVADRVFEHLPHLEDEVAYLYQAKIYAGGHLVIASPEPHRAFWQPFVLDYGGNRFGKYSPGWPALLAIGVLLGQAWVVNMFFAGLSVALIYRLASEVYNRDVGIIAAALAAFSPMALLLNGSLMGHSSALFGVTLFMYAYWRIDRRSHTLRWGIIGGIALGLVFANRPLTAIGVAVPFVAFSLVRLLRAIQRRDGTFLPILRPLLAIGSLTVLFGASVPLQSYLATGDPTKNLYTLVWSYDTVGFGDCCGRAVTRGEGGHDLERGIRHMRFDLSLMAADLYGWQIGEITPAIRNQWLLEGDYYPNLGISWILLPFGLIVAFRRNFLWVALWLIIGFGWLFFNLTTNTIPVPGGLPGQTELWISEPGPSYIWMAVAIIWLVLPLFIFGRSRARTRITWSWLFVAVSLGLIMVQLTYWIGSQRYSTRYYYEMLTSLSILSALPLAWLVQQAGKWLRQRAHDPESIKLAPQLGRFAVYGLVFAALVYGLYSYSTQRVSVLYGFNMISPAQVQAVEQRRDGNRPILVLVTGGDVRWRAFGSLMAQTSPYLDSDIVAAWDYGGVRDQILALFPDRQVIEMEAQENSAWFKGEQGPVG